MIILQYAFAIVFLAVSGYFTAWMGGSKPIKSIIRITVWGTFAMIVSALAGHLFGVNV
jgi:VIT1/CCC1 family predicted Fe2+/Mn2+ transporter